MTRAWRTLGAYECMERLVVAVLTWVVAVIVLLALFDLVREVVQLIRAGLFDPLDSKTFHLLFGQILTLLIALEFNHSIGKSTESGRSEIEVTTVLLIAIIAVARKFVLLETGDYSAQMTFALAVVVLTLGIAYRLVRERGARSPAKGVLASAPAHKAS